MRDKIRDLLPEIGEIRDQSLRERVVSVWEESITQGGWEPEELTAIPFTLLAGKIEMKFIEHVRCCAKMCLALEKTLGEVWGVQPHD